MGLERNEFLICYEKENFIGNTAVCGICFGFSDFFGKDTDEGFLRNGHGDKPEA